MTLSLPAAAWRGQGLVEYGLILGLTALFTIVILVVFGGTLAEVLDAIGAGLLVNAPETGEDISGLTEKGVPSFAPIQDNRFYFNYHHTAADTFDKVDKKHLNENAAIMAVLAYALADE